MLRITETTKGGTLLKLEGSLTGIWVTELENAWRAAQTGPPEVAISIDLSEVDQVDKAGRYLLALLCERGVRLVASGVLMPPLLSSISCDWLSIGAAVPDPR